MPVCAIYARVSDESQVRGDSIEHQISFCQEIARRRSTEAREPWLTPAACTYVDKGITGTSMVKRHEVQRLIEDARDSRFDVVLFKGISRFARDTVDALVMLRTLLACGVRVLSIEENFDSQRDDAEFVFTIHSALAQAESEKTAVRVRMGAAQKAKRGQWNGQAPSGYWLDPETKHLKIDLDYAPVIKEIFQLYLDGYGTRKIAWLLNERGQLTKLAKYWTQRTVSRILTNPVYAGDVAYGRREQRFGLPAEGEYLARRKWTHWNNNIDQVIVCRDAHPAIVERETFNRVTELMEARHQQPGRSGQLHLLSRGLLKCRCGGSMIVKYNSRKVRYYRCIRQADRGRSYCDQPFLRADEVESVILNQVRSDILAGLDIDRWDVISDEQTDIDEQHRSITLQIKKLQRDSQLLFQQFSKGTISEEQFRLMNDPVRKALERMRAGERSLVDMKRQDPLQTDLKTDLKRTAHQLLTMETHDLQFTRQLLEQLIEDASIDGKKLSIQYRFKPF